MILFILYYENGGEQGCGSLPGLCDLTSTPGLTTDAVVISEVRLTL